MNVLGVKMKIIKFFKHEIPVSRGMVIFSFLVMIFGGYIIGFFNAFRILGNALNNGTLTCF